jgi:hypothetical protein
MVAFIISKPRIKPKSGKSSRMIASRAATSIAHDSGFHMYLRTRSDCQDDRQRIDVMLADSANLVKQLSTKVNTAPEIHKDGVASSLRQLVWAILCQPLLVLL